MGISEKVILLSLPERIIMEKDKFWEYFDDESREYVQTIMDAEQDYYDKAENL